MSDRRRERANKDPFTVLRRHLIEQPAWAAMSVTGQMTYIWLRFEWKGERYNNNGSIRLSVRQLAKRLGVGINTAAAALREVQAKGFVVVTEKGALGVAGEARGPSYEGFTHEDLQWEIAPPHAALVAQHVFAPFPESTAALVQAIDFVMAGKLALALTREPALEAALRAIEADGQIDSLMVAVER